MTVLLKNGLNVKKKKKIVLYLILKIWPKKIGVSSFYFCSVHKENVST